jgi:drug/metabolite transporter (DMT)-like permease
MPKSRRLPAPAARLPDQSRTAVGRKAGVLALGAAILIWGTNWPVMKIALEQIPPLWFSCLRFVCGGACLFLLQAARGELRLPQRGDWPFIASVGLLQMTLNTALIMMALAELPAGRSAMLSYTTPMWVVPASILLFRERVIPWRLVGAALALIGVGVLISPAVADLHKPDVLGAHLMLLGASLSWAVCILHLRYFRSPSTAYQLSPWQMLIAAVPLGLAAGLWEGAITLDGSAGLWVTLIYVGPVATAFCFIAVNGASTWLSPAAMSTAMLGVPVTGVLCSAAVLGEPLTLGLTVGSLAIVAGIAVNALPVEEGARE